MTTMISEVYDALKSAGTDDDKARAATTALSTDVTDLKSEVRLIKWMVGVNLAFSLALLLEAFV